MSEMPHREQQFVGQADGTHDKRESGNELTPTKEQQEVVDGMAKEGLKLEAAVLNARETAAGKLKQLRGKELVDAGLKQMGHGVWETVKSQAKWAIGGGLVGAAGGGVVGAQVGRGVSGAALVGAAGGFIGETVGFETAGLGYNKKIAPKENLPPTKWYDWVASHAGLYGLGLLLRRSNIHVGPVSSLVINEVFNPITAGGMRNVATGLWQMRKG